MVANELARCELASSLTRRPRARRVRARAGRKQDQVAGCEFAGLRARRSADSWRRNCWRFFGRESLICKNSFYKGSCKSLLIWNEDCITL
ncbi:UNVERIFIED_CONTAM: hypothetical protein Sradi_7224400 [Sesamum radiatum]|uniref:Uncharacterized protein n=1 Tax=Sesamum radiatum TaxID=300843 RepID=A0AAW2IN30_SESRA